MTGRIHIANMAFYGYHGDRPEENAQGQRFFVDLALTLDIAEAARTDRLSDTVDYAKVYALCRRIVETEKHRLLETLAKSVMDAILHDCPRVSRVEITIKKPGAPIRGVLDHVAVEASCERGKRLARTRK